MAHLSVNENTQRSGLPARHSMWLASFVLLAALLAACGSTDGAQVPDIAAAPDEATDATGPTATSVAETTSTSTSTTSSTSTTLPATTTTRPSTTTAPPVEGGDLWDLSAELMYQKDEENWLEWQWGGNFTIDGSGVIRGTGLGSIAGSGNCRWWSNDILQYDGPPYPLLGGFGVQISGSVDEGELDLQVTGTDAFASFEETDPNCETEFWGTSEDFAVMIAELNVADLVPDRRLTVPAEMYLGEIEIPELGTLTIIVLEP